MPVKKSSKNTEKTIHICNDIESPLFQIGGHAKKLVWTLIGILLVYAIVWMATIIRNNLQQYYYISQSGNVSKTIVVSESADVSMKPDIAMTTLGMISVGTTVKEAQDNNTAVMNNVIAGLKDLGVDDADIQTAQYNVYPKYTYTSIGERLDDGYEVSQNVTVKIRDLSKANNVIALAGQFGANSVGGLQFDIDNTDALKQKARQEALQKVKAKAQQLSESLGVEIVGVMSYDEYEGGTNGPMYYKQYAEADMGGVTPAIEAGESKVTMTVSVTYEIR